MAKLQRETLLYAFRCKCSKTSSSTEVYIGWFSLDELQLQLQDTLVNETKELRLYNRKTAIDDVR